MTSLDSCYEPSPSSPLPSPPSHYGAHPLTDCARRWAPHYRPLHLHMHLHMACSTCSQSVGHPRVTTDASTVGSPGLVSAMGNDVPSSSFSLAFPRKLVKRVARLKCSPLHTSVLRLVHPEVNLTSHLLKGGEGSVYKRFRVM